MLSLLLLSVFTIKISSKPLNSCSVQSSCFSVSYKYKSDTVNICIKYDNSFPNCNKDGSISYACFNNNESEKIEGFNSGDEMCIEASCNTPHTSRYVEFGFKDGNKCADTGKDETIVTIQGAFGDVKCRPANAKQNDVLCGGGAKKECIHKIYYDECPTHTTTTVPIITSTISDITSTNSPVTTTIDSIIKMERMPTPVTASKCNDQAPCLQVDYDDSWGDGLVNVCITFDATKPNCAKDNNILDGMCYSENDNMVGQTFIASGTRTCILANCYQKQFIEFAFNDGIGCDGEDTNVLIDGIIQPVECISAIGTNFCNEKQCIYSIPVIGGDCGDIGSAKQDVMIRDGIPKNDKLKNNDNMVAMDVLSNSEVIGFIGIIIGCICIICFVCGYICMKRRHKIDRNEMRNGMEVIKDQSEMCEGNAQMTIPVSVISTVSMQGTQQMNTNILIQEEERLEI
eukprot:82999_1